MSSYTVTFRPGNDIIQAQLIVWIGDRSAAILRGKEAEIVFALAGDAQKKGERGVIDEVRAHLHGLKKSGAHGDQLAAQELGELLAKIDPPSA